MYILALKAKMKYLLIIGKFSLCIILHHEDIALT